MVNPVQKLVIKHPYTPDVAGGGHIEVEMSGGANTARKGLVTIHSTPIISETVFLERVGMLLFIRLSICYADTNDGLNSKV